MSAVTDWEQSQDGRDRRRTHKPGYRLGPHVPREPGDFGWRGQCRRQYQDGPPCGAEVFTEPDELAAHMLDVHGVRLKMAPAYKVPGPYSRKAPSVVEPPASRREAWLAARITEETA